MRPSHVKPSKLYTLTRFNFYLRIGTITYLLLCIFTYIYTCMHIYHTYLHTYTHTHTHTYTFIYIHTYIHTPDLALERKATGPLDAHWRWTACLDVNMTVAAMHCAWKIRVSTFLFSRKCWHALGALRVTHRMHTYIVLHWIILD